MSEDLENIFTSFTAQLTKTESYREPTPHEVATTIRGLNNLLTGKAADSLLEPLGFTISAGVDKVSHKPYTLVQSEYAAGERKWGWFLLDPTRPLRLIVAVPHPKADEATERFGLDTWHRVAGACLIMAGAHRLAPLGSAPADHPHHGLADPAHSSHAMFNQVIKALSERGTPQLQWHGFADTTALEFDAIISPAATIADGAIKRFADEAEKSGLRVGREWDGTAVALLSRNNEQSKIARLTGAPFIHCEISNTVRVQPDGAARRTAIKNAAIAAKIAGTGA